LKFLRYDKVEAKVIRQFERYGIKPADPEYYSTLYGDSLLDTNMLLAKARELGITEDLVCYFFHMIKLYLI
jgi:hypothetical protein